MGLVLFSDDLWKSYSRIQEDSRLRACVHV